MKRVLYSKDLEGFLAAFAAYQKFNDQATYEVVSSLENLGPFDKHEELYLLSFLLEKKKLLEIKRQVKKLVLICFDPKKHEDFKALSFAHMDPNKSSSSKAWEYFNSENPRPWFYEVLERAVFEKTPSSEELLVKALNSYKRDFSLWKDLDKDAVEKEGEILQKFQGKLQDDLLEKVLRRQYGPYEIPAINSPLYSEELTQSLLGAYPKAPFVEVFWEEGQEVKQVFRSRVGGFDLLKFFENTVAVGRQDLLFLFQKK